MIRGMTAPAALLALALCAAPAATQQQFDKAVKDVNQKMVKIYGLGGFRGLPAYGTGMAISADGYILTVSGYLIESPKDLRVHLADGRRFDKIKVVAVEPELDAALLKVEDLKDEIPFFDLKESAKRPAGQPGDWVLAFSNQFEIATRNEPMTVQRGSVASVSRLRARKGITEAPYNGEVYVVDAITNNPGAGGGALTTRKGELIGMVGKELRNTLTDTWTNYALPLNAKIEVIPDAEKPDVKATVSLLDFIDKGIKGTYKTVARVRPEGGTGGYHGIILVTNPEGVDRAPPYIEEVRSGSPGAKVGLKSDDLIVYVNGELVSSVKTFKDIISKTKPTDEITLEVKRGDKLRQVTVKLEDHPKVAKVPAPK